VHSKVFASEQFVFLSFSSHNNNVLIKKPAYDFMNFMSAIAIIISAHISCMEASMQAIQLYIFASHTQIEPCCFSPHGFSAANNDDKM
jgi:hypothetical protein